MVAAFISKGKDSFMKINGYSYTNAHQTAIADNPATNKVATKKSENDVRPSGIYTLLNQDGDSYTSSADLNSHFDWSAQSPGTMISGLDDIIQKRILDFNSRLGAIDSNELKGERMSEAELGEFERQFFIHDSFFLTGSNGRVAQYIPFERNFNDDGTLIGWQPEQPNTTRNISNIPTLTIGNDMQNLIAQLQDGNIEKMRSSDDGTLKMFVPVQIMTMEEGLNNRDFVEFVDPRLRLDTPDSSFTISASLNGGQPMTWSAAIGFSYEIARHMIENHYSKFVNTGINLENNITSEHIMNGFRAAVANADFSNIDDAEKYMAIHGLYARTFGENFLMGGAITYNTGLTDCIYKAIYSQFKDDLATLFGSAEKAAQAARTAIYGNKSDTEIRAEIMAKYPPSERMTLRDLHFMTWEMAQVGLDDGLHEVVLNATSFWSHVWRPDGFILTVDDSTRLREHILDQRLDSNFLCIAYNSLLRSRSVTAEAGLRLQETIGVLLDTSGLASPMRPQIDLETVPDWAKANIVTVGSAPNWFESIVEWITNDNIVANSQRRYELHTGFFDFMKQNPDRPPSDWEHGLLV
jgi:hypothetical protein